MSDRGLVTYRVQASAAEIAAHALALAIEQSVEMPPGAIRDPRVADAVLGQVRSIVPEGPDRFRVTVALALETFGRDAGQLMNMLFGNSSLHPHVELADLELPPAAAAGFGGPRFGIAGLRQLTGNPHAPLTCGALKPLGSTVAALAELAGTLAAAGIDLIKDDHGLADQSSAPFARRVTAVQQAVAAANRATGGRTLYAPSLSGGPRRLLEQARLAREAGVGMLMLAPMLSGLSALQELTELGLPLIAHPALGGAGRIAPPLLIGRLFRLAGADAVIYPNHGGRFGYSVDTCGAIAAAAREPWQGLRPALPVPAGGMQVERVDELIGCYGPDTMLLIGGALLEAADPGAAARAFVARTRRMAV